jgi:hypothetical protein
MEGIGGGGDEDEADWGKKQKCCWVGAINNKKTSREG